MAVKMVARSTFPILEPPIDSSSFCRTLNVCTTPPAPPPPPPPPPSFNSTTIRFKHTSLVAALPIATASLVVAASLALLVAFFIVRLHRRRRDRGPAAEPAPGDPGADAVLDGGDGEEEVHHAWYIRTVGVDESAIQSITAWAYKAGEGVLGDSATDCTVCLSEFHDGELVRLLPRCSHAFHLSCIDTWLRSHVNCPLCRAPIVAPNTALNSEDPGTSTTFSSPSSSTLPSPESGLDHTDTEPIFSAPADSNQTDGRQLEAVGTLKVQMECERLHLGGRKPTVVGPSQIPDFLVSIDIGEDGFQPIRRSVSMDSFISVVKLDEDLRVIIPNRKNPTWEEEWKERTRAKHSCISSFRREVGRSLVSASGRFFSSAQGRARNAVLPV